MRDLVTAAAEVQKILDGRRWKFCFIGGIAVQKWGQVRMTRDIDLTIFTGVGDELPFIDQLVEWFVPKLKELRKIVEGP